MAWAVFFLLPRRARNPVLALLSLLFCLWGRVQGHSAAGGLHRLQLAGRAGAGPGGQSQKAAAGGLCGAGSGGAGLFQVRAGFVSENLATLLPGAVPVVSIALPLGLSFYTFQGIAYCVDVARGDTPPAHNPVRFSLYMAFFAHVTSGPILRYGEHAPWLDPVSPERRITLDRFCYGIKRFTLGLAKKALLADQLGVFHDRVVSVPAASVPAPVLLAGCTALRLPALL